MSDSNEAKLIESLIGKDAAKIVNSYEVYYNARSAINAILIAIETCINLNTHKGVVGNLYREASNIPWQVASGEDRVKPYIYNHPMDDPRCQHLLNLIKEHKNHWFPLVE